MKLQDKPKTKIKEIEVNKKEICNHDQVIVTDSYNGERNFKHNKIVKMIFEYFNSTTDQMLGSRLFSQEDKDQFAQLLGMNVNEYINHPSISENAKLRAKKIIDNHSAGC